MGARRGWNPGGIWPEAPGLAGQTPTVQAFDAGHQLRSAVTPTGVLAGTAATLYAYDDRGNRILVEDSFGGQVESSYDDLGRLLTRIFEQTGQPTLRLDYNITDKHRLSGSTNITRLKSTPDTTNSREPVYPAAGDLAPEYAWEGLFAATPPAPASVPAV